MWEEPLAGAWPQWILRTLWWRSQPLGVGLGPENGAFLVPFYEGRQRHHRRSSSKERDRAVFTQGFQWMQSNIWQEGTRWGDGYVLCMDCDCWLHGPQHQQLESRGRKDLGWLDMFIDSFITFPGTKFRDRKF